MPVARPEPQEVRVIAHVDLDCFYVQVEQRKRPELRGKPAAVVQYNSWKGGGLIAVGYEAREFGVKRSMRGDEAKNVCPDIQLIQVPVARGKADLTLYREAGSEVVSVLARKGICERASIDEVYLDITDAAAALLLEQPLQLMESFSDEVLKMHILGHSKDAEDRKEMVKSWLCRNDADHRDQMLACGAIIVAELRMQVLSETQFTCSAGIAHNKMLAKLASGMHKPAQQTIVPAASVPDLLAVLPVKKMKQLGGKLGSSLESDLGVQTVGDLLQFPESKLQERYGMNTGTWLWNIARGISGDEVKGRLLPKSQGCGKTFPGPRALRTIASVEHWLGELSAELNDRIQGDLEKNKRIAHQLSLHARAYQESGMTSRKKFPSKSCPLRYGKDKILQDALQLFERGLREYCGGYGRGKRESQHGWAITGLSIMASNIYATPSGVNPITRFFQGSTCMTDSSAELHSFADDPYHDESMQELNGLGEAYVNDVAENNAAGIQGSVLEIETRRRNEDCFSNCSFTEAEDTCSSIVGGLKSSVNSGEIMNQVKEELVPNHSVPELSDDICDRHASSLYHPTNDPICCSKSLARGLNSSVNPGEIMNRVKEELVPNGSVQELSDGICDRYASSLCHPTNDPLCCSKSSARQKEPRFFHACNRGKRFLSESSTQGHEQKRALQKIDRFERKVDKTVCSFRLEDIWKKHAATSSIVSSTQKREIQDWYYKAEDIDESTLSELPEEIQQELRSSLRQKQPQATIRPTIADYFRHNSNA